MGRKLKTCFLIVIFLTILSLTFPIASASRIEMPTSSVICSSGRDIGVSESQENTSFGHRSIRFGSEYVAPSDIELPTPSFPLLKDVKVTINIVFVGVPFPLLDVTVMRSKLLRWYAPVDRMRWEKEQKLIPYVNYTYHYNVDFAPSEMANAYIQFLINNYRNDTAPYWIQQSPYSSANASYISAIEAENWFATNFPQYQRDYTLFIVDTNHTSPSFPYRYFYNASVKDIDSGLDPRRSASKYMIAFGGNHRFLFLDLSAGPAKYEDVDDLNVPPIWTYALNETVRFSTDGAKYVNRAIQERFTSSWIYAPTYFEKYHVEVIIFNNDTTFNYLDHIDLNKIIEEHRRLQPFSSWSGEKRQVALSDEPALYSVVKKAYDRSEKTVKYDRIYSYLLANLSRYITPYGDARIVPVFIFAFPETIKFEFLGITDADGKGNPAFVVMGTNQFLLGQKVYQSTWANRTFSVLRGYLRRFYGELGGVGGRDRLDGGFNVTAGKIDFYILDEFNYYQWYYDKPYKAYIEARGVSGEYSFSFTPPGYTAYYIIFYNPHAYTSTASVNFKAFHSYWVGYGLTQCAIHETGHFICLSHPHDYFDWEHKYSYNTSWLWDFSATPMGYATQNYRFDKLDSDAVHRGRTLSVLNATYRLLNYVKSKMTSYGFGIVPPIVYSNINASLRSSALAVRDFSTFDSLDNYKTGVGNSLDAYKYALTANSTLFSSLLRLTNRIQDANGKPLINAKVMVTYPNGTVRTLYSNSSGYFTVTNAPWGNFTYTIYWQGTKVSGAVTSLENANITRTIPVSVYSLSFIFKDSAGAPLYASPTEITLTAPNGTRLRLTSFIINQAQNGTWAVSSIIWQNNNVVPPELFMSINSNAVWSINCRVYSIDFTESFKDSRGVALYISPSSFKLICPNGTTTFALSVGSYYLQNGTYRWKSVVWRGIDVVPSPSPTFDPTGGSPTVKCRVYPLTVYVKDYLTLAVSGAEVGIYLPDGTLLTSGRSGGGGEITFSQLPISDYKVEVTFLGLKTIAALSLTSDKTMEIRILLSIPMLVIICIVAGISIGGTLYLKKRK